MRYHNFFSSKFSDREISWFETECTESLVGGEILLLNSKCLLEITQKIVFEISTHHTGDRRRAEWRVIFHCAVCTGSIWSFHLSKTILLRVTLCVRKSNENNCQMWANIFNGVLMVSIQINLSEIVNACLLITIMFLTELGSSTKISNRLL